MHYFDKRVGPAFVPCGWLCPDFRLLKKMSERIKHRSFIYDLPIKRERERLKKQSGSTAPGIPQDHL